MVSKHKFAELARRVGIGDPARQHRAEFGEFRRRLDPVNLAVRFGERSPNAADPPRLALQDDQHVRPGHALHDQADAPFVLDNTEQGGGDTISVDLGLAPRPGSAQSRGCGAAHQVTAQDWSR